MPNYNISIIIPVLNGEEFIERAIISLLNQTLKDIQIIISDGGSTDQTLEICEKLQDKNPNIEIITNTGESGTLSQNIVRGLKHVKSPYVGFLDADDYVEGKMYEDLLKLALKYDSDIVKSSLYTNFDNTIYNVTDEKFILKRKNIFENFGSISRCDLIHKSNLIPNITKYYSLYDGNYWEDTLYSYILFWFSKSITKVNKKYYIYTENKKSNSRTTIYSKNYFDNFNVLFSLYKNLNDKSDYLNQNYFYVYLSLKNADNFISKNKDRKLFKEIKENETVKKMFCEYKPEDEKEFNYYKKIYKKSFFAYKITVFIKRLKRKIKSL